MNRNYVVSFLVAFFFFQTPHLLTFSSEEAEKVMKEYRAAPKGSEGNAIRRKLNEKVVRIGNPAIKAVLETIYDEKIVLHLRGKPLLILHDIKTPEAKEALKNILLDKKVPRDIRHQAGVWWSLQCSSVKEAKEVLEKGLEMKKEGGVVRHSCVIALGRLKDRAGLPLLFSAFNEADMTLQDKDFPGSGGFVRRWILSTLILMSEYKDPISGNMVPDKCWKSFEVLCKGAVSFPIDDGRIYPMPEYKDGKVIYHPEAIKGRPYRKSMAVEMAHVLGHIRDGRSVRLLEYLIKHTDSRVRKSAISAIAKQPGDRVPELLRQASTEDPDEPNRAFAKELLKQRDTKK